MGPPTPSDQRAECRSLQCITDRVTDMEDINSLKLRLGRHLKALLQQLEVSPDNEAIQACASISRRSTEVLRMLDLTYLSTDERQSLEDELLELHRQAHVLVRMVIDNRSIFTNTSQEQEATVRRLHKHLTSAPAIPDSMEDPPAVCSSISCSSSFSRTTRSSSSDDFGMAIRRLLVREGVFETLTLAMYRGSEDQKTDATLVLSHAPTNDPVLAQLAIAHRSIDALSGLLVSGSPLQRQHAARGLRSLLGLDQDQLDVLRETWPRIQQIKHGNEQQQIEAGAVLRAWVTKGAQYQTMVASLGAISTLSQLVRSGSPTQMHQAADVLGALASDHQANQQAIIATGVCSVLQALLKRASPSTKAWAKTALHQIDPDVCLNLNDIHDAPQVTPLKDLITLLTTGSDQQKSHAATDLIKKLAKHPNAQEDIARAGAISAFMKLLRNGTSSHKQYAMVALMKLAARNEAHRQCIVQEGALPRLEDLLFCGTEREQELAEEALTLLQSPQCRKGTRGSTILMNSSSSSYAKSPQGGSATF